MGRSAVSAYSFPEVWVPSLEADFSLGVFFYDDDKKNEIAERTAREEALCPQIRFLKFGCQV